MDAVSSVRFAHVAVSGPDTRLPDPVSATDLANCRNQMIAEERSVSKRSGRRRIDFVRVWA